MQLQQLSLLIESLVFSMRLLSWGQGILVTEANNKRRSLNLRGLNAFDLRLKPDGTPWNLNDNTDRHLAQKMIEEGRRPRLDCRFTSMYSLQRMEPADELSKDGSRESQDCN